MDNLEYYINQFTWWISSDEYLTPDGACFDMENVDINKSSMCITASRGAWTLMNSRQHWNVIAVSQSWEEWVTEDGMIESRNAYGGNRGSGVCGLFAFPMLWPKLKSSGGGTIVSHTRHEELKTAIRGNAWSYPFWLLLNNKTFSLVNPDALSGTTDLIGWPSSEDLSLWTGWTYYPDAELWACIKHSSWTASITVDVSSQYISDDDYTVTNYQMFWIGVQNHKHWGFRVKVTADLDVFQWDDDDWVFDYDSTDSDQHKTWNWVTKSKEDWERFCYAVNGVHTKCTWEIQPSDDFDGELFRVWALNQKNYLTADGDNNPDHWLSLDNSTVKDLGRAWMSIDTTDLQDRAVITEWKGNYVVWAWNYAVIMNTNIVKDGYQVKPFLDIILATSYEIMGITTFGDQITFYANSNWNGFQIVWDGASLYANYIYTWAGQQFETIISSLGYDYVTVRSARNEMQYYVVNWPQRNQIWWSMSMSSSSNDAYKAYWKDQNTLLTQRDDREIWGQLGAMWCWQPAFAWLYGDLIVYGSRKAWIGNAWYKPISLGSYREDLYKYSETDCVWPFVWGSIALYYTDWDWCHRVSGIYTWYWNDGIWSTYYVWNRRFSYTLNPIIGSHFLEKEVDKFFISYKLPNEQWEINLYAKVDDDMFIRILPSWGITIAKWDIYAFDSDHKDKVEYIWQDWDWYVFRRMGQRSRMGRETLYRVNWEWTSTIYVNDMDNRVKVGHLEYNGFDHNYQNLMNTQVVSGLPFFHKIQFKIEWVCVTEDEEAYPYTETIPPEIYNIYIPLKQHTVW